MEMINANELVYAYDEQDGARRSLDGISLTVDKGELVAVLGHNGCGKTTLARHLNALLPVQEGELTVAGCDARDENRVWQIRKSCGMVFQNPDNQFVSSFVEEDIAFGPRNFGADEADIPEKVRSALAAVGMAGFERRSPQLLSGGQKQRIAIAGVLATDPDIMVFDEVTSMLDPQGRQEVISTVTRLCREKGMTVVLITHHMDECIGADRLVVMSNGSIIADGTPGAVFSDVALMEREGLSVPETVRLMYELNSQGFALPLDALSPDECAKRIAESLS